MPTVLLLSHGCKTEHRMQLICDGVESKQDVLEASLMQYREVFIKARRDFDILCNVSAFSSANSLLKYAIQCVAQSLGGRGIAAGNVARRPPPPGGRGPGGGNGGNDDDGPPGGDGGPPPAPAKRAKAVAAGKTTAAKKAAAKSKLEEAAKKAPAKRTRKTAAAQIEPVPCMSRLVKPVFVVDGFDSNIIAAPSTFIPPATPGGTHEVIMCNCGERAVPRTVAKEGPTKGKQFWTCAKPMGDSTKCKFFVRQLLGEECFNYADSVFRNGMAPRLPVHRHLAL